MGKVRRLVTKQEREHRAAFASAAAVLRDLPPQAVACLPARHRALISQTRSALRRHATSQEGIWPNGGFNMIGRVQAKHVYDRIRRLPPEDRPVQVRDAFVFILCCLDQDTPELPFTRQELADEIGCDVRNVSKIMRTLEELGVLTRERRAEPGYRGRGRVVYVVNAHTAWNGNLELRRQVASGQQPPSEREEPRALKRAKLKLVPPAEAAE